MVAVNISVKVGYSEHGDEPMLPPAYSGFSDENSLCCRTLGFANEDVLFQ